LSGGHAAWRAAGSLGNGTGTRRDVRCSVQLYLRCHTFCEVCTVVDRRCKTATCCFSLFITENVGSGRRRQCPRGAASVPDTSLHYLECSMYAAAGRRRLAVCVAFCSGVLQEFEKEGAQTVCQTNGEYQPEGRDGRMDGQTERQMQQARCGCMRRRAMPGSGLPFGAFHPRPSPLSVKRTHINSHSLFSPPPCKPAGRPRCRRVKSTNGNSPVSAAARDARIMHACRQRQGCWGHGNGD